MAEVTFLSPVVWKENWLLERQLNVKQQIIKEEHRMKTTSLERYVRDVRKFLVCIQHRTPGLAGFRHPNTKLMNSRKALQRPVEHNISYVKQEVSPKCQLNKRHNKTKSDCEERNSGDFPRKLLTDNCKIQTLEDNQNLVVTTKLECDSSKFPKYGAAANSVQDQIWRMEVLSRFETIFDRHAHEHPKITHDSPEIPDSYHTNRDVTDIAKVQERLSPPRPRGYDSCTSATRSIGLVTLRRLTWSAPSTRATLASIEAKTTNDLTNSQLAPSRAAQTHTEAKTTTDLTNPQLASSRAAQTHIEAKTTTDLTNPQLASSRAAQTHIEVMTTTDLTNSQLTPSRATQASIEAKTTTDLTNPQLAPSRAAQTHTEAKTTTDLTNPQLAPSRATQASIEAKTTTDLTNPQLAPSRAAQTHTEAKTTTDLTNSQLAPSRATQASIEAKTTTGLTNAQLAPSRAAQTHTEAKTTTDLTNPQLAPSRAAQTHTETKTTTDVTNSQSAPSRATQAHTETKTTIDLTNSQSAPSRAIQTSIEAKTTIDLTNPKLAPSRAAQTSIEAKTTIDLTNPQLADKLSATETRRVPQQIPTAVESIMSSHKPAEQQLQNKLKRPKTAPPKCPQPERAACVSRQQIAGFLAEVHSRKADIQALLKKSKQLQETVRMLDPDREQTAEEGDLINEQMF